MNPFEELIKLFNINIIEVNDNLMNTSVSKQLEFNQIPKYEEIDNILKKFNKRDCIEIFLSDESDENIIISNNVNSSINYNKFLKNNEEVESKIFIKINVKKDVNDCKVSIFNVTSFFDNFLKNTIIDNLKFFDYRYKCNSNIIFINYDNNYFLNTNSIIMINNDTTLSIDEVNRKEMLERCNSVSNFSNNMEYSLLPEDFAVISTNMDNEFIERLKQIKILFSLIYIADYSSLDENILKLKLNGYRNKDYNICLSNFKYEKKYEEFYKIYRWIFQESNEYDKITLTRHVISMYCKYSDILEIDEKTFLAIKSNYNIYIKNNVDKYIEVKKQLTEFISDTSNEINNIIGNFIGNFERNIAAFVTFILGTIIANLVSDSPLDNILTKDIVTIIFIILIGSVGYLIITIVETYFRFLSYKKNYFNLKQSYTDILNEQDIENIFKNDKVYKENKRNVKIISLTFSILWIILIFSIFVFVYLNYNSDYIKKIIDIFYFFVKYLCK